MIVQKSEARRGLLIESEARGVDELGDADDDKTGVCDDDESSVYDCSNIEDD